jgi:hypothetical protein
MPLRRQEGRSCPSRAFLVSRGPSESRRSVDAMADPGPNWTDVVSAIAVIAQLVVLVAAAAFAWRQVREAKQLREAQTRPFVVIDFEVENFLAFLTVTNIGTTLARDVRFEIDPPLQTKIENPLAEMKMLRDGIPTLAPRKTIRTLFDSLVNREPGELPDTYAVVVRYSDETGRRFEDDLDLDLAVYWNLTTVERHDIHHVHARLKEILAEVKKWRSATGRGLLRLSPEEAREENERTRRYVEERRRQRDGQDVRSGWAARMITGLGARLHRGRSG